ncbi:hypothetical protein JW826_02585 [Candidatus Woesearchaeota archaeon]|nr:hypothetical protein [Candidatus Woesearchaeota archaeon]
MEKPRLGVFYWHNPTRVGNLFLVGNLRSDFHVLIISNENAPFLKRFGDDVLVSHYGNVTGIIEELRKYRDKSGLDGLITLSEGAVTLLADAQESLNIEGNDAAATRFGRNKHWMRKLFAEKGIPSPKSIAVHSLEEAMTIAKKEFDWTLFLKPPCIGGSAYCRKITGPTQLQEVWEEYFEGSKERTAKDPLFQEMFGKEGSGYYLLMEELLGGTRLPYDDVLGKRFPVFEMSVEGFIEGDRTKAYSMTDKMLPEKGVVNCEEYLWRMHSRIPSGMKKVLVERVNLINRALGMRSGCSHTEFRIEETTREHADAEYEGVFYRARVIETAMRIGGAYMQPAIYQATGFNSIRAMADQACRIESKENVLFRMPMIMGNIWPEKEGIMEGILGLDNILTLGERCGGVRIYDRNGARVAIPPEACRAIGDFIIQDPSQDVLNQTDWETKSGESSPYRETETAFLDAITNIKVRLK